MKLQDRKILLGVTGSIAAYKAAFLIRSLVSEGAEVQIVMTKPAKEFITPLSLSTLSGRPVLSDFSDTDTGQWVNHVEWGLWADLILVAPVTANTLAKLAHGRADDLLSTICLSARCPIFLAPAMDLDMFIHPSTQQNLNALVNFGYRVIGPGSGALASGLSGEGRMTEPEDIVESIVHHFAPNPYLEGKKVLISAGPTREAIDPVRYISNHSSGKMGVALAEEFALRGAQVFLVVGPGVNPPKNGSIVVHRVVSAAEMESECIRLFPDATITIMAAAVADYTPVHAEKGKIKKKEETFQLSLRKTTDIVALMGEMKKQGQFVAGFALETDDELKNAISKLESKNLDLIVLNSMNDPGAGFNSPFNKITMIEKNHNITPCILKPKAEVASDIADKIISLLTHS